MNGLFHQLVWYSEGLLCVFQFMYFFLVWVVIAALPNWQISCFQYHFIVASLHRFTKVLTSVLSVVVIAINMWFVVTFLDTSLSDQWWLYILVSVLGVFYFSLIIYLSLFLVPAFGFSYCCNIPVRVLWQNLGMEFLMEEEEELLEWVSECSGGMRCKEHVIYPYLPAHD